MSNDDRLRTLRGEVLRPGDPMYEPMPRTPSPPGHAGIINVFGALKLHAEKRGYQRFQAMLEAQEGAHLALVNLMKAKEAVGIQSVRLQSDSLEDLKETERENIRLEREAVAMRRLEQEATIAQKQYEIAEAKAKLASLQHKEEVAELERKVEIKRLKEELYGKPIDVEPDDAQAKFNELLVKAAKFREDYAEARKRPDFTEAEDMSWREKFMAMDEEIENFGQ